MSHNNNSNHNYIVIWILHYIIYYMYFSIILNCISRFYLGRTFTVESITSVLLSPLGGAIGLFDGLVIIIPVVLHYLLTKIYPFYKAYLITSIICYSTICLYFFSKSFIYEFQGNLYENKLHIYPAFIIFPGVVISSYFIWLYTRKRLRKSE